MIGQNFHFRGESRTLDAKARAAAPRQFVKLADGMVHYELAGPEDAQTVVLVHGFSVPNFIWDPTFEALLAADLRVLRYDLYGRGYSDRPDAAYDQDLFDQQLSNLLTALDIQGPVDLIGLSMGGAIVVTFTARHPALVRKLCLIDPAGLPQKYPPAAKLIEAPMLGEWLFSLFGDKILLSSLSDDFHDPDGLAEYVEKYRVQMQYEGFKRALLSTIRNHVLAGAAQAYESVGQMELPVLLIWGRQDTVVPFSQSEKVIELIPRIEFHAIEGAGHIAHYERPELVDPLLIDFLTN